MLITGEFTRYNGVDRYRIAGLNGDGSLDTTFDSGSFSSGVTVIHAMALQPDGKVIIGGYFTSYNGRPRKNLARVNMDGSNDETFARISPNRTVYAVQLQADGKVLIGGEFTQFTGANRNNLARLFGNGQMDHTFDPGAGVATEKVNEIAVQPDGKILIGGGFTSYDGIGRNHIARIFSSVSPPSLYAILMLSGPSNGSRMNDHLRSLPSFPLTEPFTAMGYSQAEFLPGATIAPSVLTVSGVDAIVDWVVVEMRPASSPSTVLASRAALLHTDGNIVDLDGVSNLEFPGLVPGDYCVAVRSRSHLPVMLSPTTPISYGGIIAIVDFTLASTQIFDDDSREYVNLVMHAVAGDINFDGTVAYTGAGNDRDLILQRIGGVVPTNTVAGYWPEDVNMDGVVMYTGSGNDRDRILVSVGGSTPTATRVATLP
jgi:uncharacterized delta-60 repeat protein